MECFSLLHQLFADAVLNANAHPLLRRLVRKARGSKLRNVLLRAQAQRAHRHKRAAAQVTLSNLSTFEVLQRTELHSAIWASEVRTAESVQLKIARSSFMYAVCDAVAAVIAGMPCCVSQRSATWAVETP